MSYCSKIASQVQPSPQQHLSLPWQPMVNQHLSRTQGLNPPTLFPLSMTQPSSALTSCQQLRTSMIQCRCQQRRTSTIESRCRLPRPNAATMFHATWRAVGMHLSVPCHGHLQRMWGAKWTLTPFPRTRFSRTVLMLLEQHNMLSITLSILHQSQTPTMSLSHRLLRYQ